jgi:Uma2 family endonuclease
MLDAPQSLLDERRRTGADRFDEVWDGVLHMVPPPSLWHQRFGSRLLEALLPVARSLGLEVIYEAGVFRPGHAERDYRQPDLLLARPDQMKPRGIEGPCELVIEILSPHDETYEKLPFYAELGVREVWVLDPDTRAIELFVLRGGKLHAALPDDSGGVRSPILGVTLSRDDGPKLRLRWSSGETSI